MQAIFIRPSLCVAVLGLAACGGGGSGDGSGGSNTGTNGLDYASGQSLNDAEGIEMTLAAAEFAAGSSLAVGSGTVTLNAGFLSGGPLNGEVQIFGETVTITNGTGVLSNGQEVTLVYENDRSGSYAGAIEVVSYGTDQPGIIGPEDGETHYVFGFETNPTTVDVISGSFDYTGDFQASGLNSGTETEYEGTITFNVNFDTDAVTGSLDGSFDSSTSIDMELESDVMLSDNGFTGALTCTLNCTGANSGIDATFYGPDADELGGVLVFNFNDFNGVGTFVIPVMP